jgi:hypothetical protein
MDKEFFIGSLVLLLMFSCSLTQYVHKYVKTHLRHDKKLKIKKM